MGLLDNYKKILSDYKTQVIDEVKERVLGTKSEEIENSESEELMSDFEEEDFFISAGADSSLKRYYQALTYGSEKKPIYGLECNACCVMYFLQSYGLYPPTLSRKKFEYLFTKLNPPIEVKGQSQNDKPKGKGGYYIEGDKKKLLRPKEDMFDTAFANPNMFLQGKSGAILPHTGEGITKLTAIYQKFNELSSLDGYKFLEKYKQKYYSLDFSNKYEALVNGITDKGYFERNVIFIGLYNNEGLYHYCLIVNTPTKEYLTLGNVKYSFWLYPTDDPYYGNQTVFVPTKETKLELSNFISLGVYLIYPQCAIGV
jgi:hypothetical protein